MMLEREDIEDILQLIDSSEYNRLSVKTDRFSLQLSRNEGGVWQAEQRVDLAPVVEALSGESSATALVPDPTVADAVTEGVHAVRAPLPGTFYRAPRPGAAPFINEGDAVTADTVVCIVETMKLMNSVQAGATGIVSRILVDNGVMVEQGAAMVLIEPSH